MLPGMNSAIEARLRALLAPAVTGVSEESYAALGITLVGANEAEAGALGISFAGGTEVVIAVTDPNRPVGQVRVQAGGADNTLFFDNRTAGGNLFANIRVAGSGSFLLFNRIGDAFVSLPDVFLRSDSQFLFWGEGASAVGCNIEIEGDGHGVVIGDDALIAGGVWIRNCDMHAMHDLDTGTRISRRPVDTVLERHVWLGQDALLLNCDRVGMGSIVGARSLLKGAAPPRVAMAGTPARVIRTGVSWGRSIDGMSEAERASIGLASILEA
jgi:acetyltransferase-like isoleucine patch superfamily enzyme